MRFGSRLPLVLLVVLALLGCQRGMGPIAPPLAGDGLVPTTRSRVAPLAIMVAFPERRTQATSGDVVEGATVSLIDATLSSTVVSGVTDGSGRVSLQPGASFNPAVGDTFVLEAVKGLANHAAGHVALRLRTVVRWSASGWESMSGLGAGGTLHINTLTTAVALVSALDPVNVPASSTIGKVDASIVPATLRPTPTLPAHPDAEIRELEAMVREYVTSDLDPVGSVNRLVPVIAAITPARGPAGTMFSVAGQGFSPLPGSNTILMNGATASVMMASGTRIIGVVPPITTPGPVSVTVSTRLGTSGAASFLVEPSPVIAAFAPAASASVGDSIVIHGAGFSPIVQDNHVFFGDVAGMVTSADSGQLTVTVPSATDGDVLVKVPGLVSNALPFAIWRSLVEDFSSTIRMDTAASTGVWRGGMATMRPEASFGTGSDGAFHPTSDTMLPAGTYHFSSIEIPAGVTVTVTGGGIATNGGSGTPLVLNSTGAVTLMGSLVADGGAGSPNSGRTGGAGGTAVAGGYAGGVGGTSPDSGTAGAGVGPASGTGGAGGTNNSNNNSTRGGNGGGAGHGAAGSAGIGSNRGNGAAGSAYGTPQLSGQGGAGGGAGGAYRRSSIGGAGGGAGGGSIEIRAQLGLIIGGTVSVRGGDGGTPTNANAGAGGGGAGGSLYLYAPTINLQGATLTAAGGAGGVGGGGAGGSGAVGRIRIDGTTTGTPALVTPDVGYQGAMTYSTVTPSVIQSLGYDTGATKPVAYTGFVPTLTLPAGTSVLWEFSDSADDAIWGAWTTDLTSLNQRYVRFRATLSTGVANATPVLQQAIVRYHW